MGKLKKMFFWCGVLLFDAAQKQYGGFNHFLAGNVFRWKLCYLELSLTYKLRFKWVHECDYHYYDGYHNHLHLGFLRVVYGT
jgi:hypothetical protein